MSINLNQTITLDQFKQLGKQLKSSRAIFISLISMLLIVFFAINCYAIYGNYEVYEQKNAEFLEISNQMKITERRLSKLVNSEAKYFLQLGTSPASQSEMVDLLSNFATSSNLIVKKLLANEGGQNKEKDGLVEMELDGRYPSIQEFLVRIKPVLAASNVQLVRLEKKKENQYVHMTMAVKFSKPPELRKVKSSVAFNFKGANFFYDTFDGWRISKAGFVQVPQGSVNSVAPQDGAGKATTPPEVIDNQKRVDPFLPSPKTNQGDAGIKLGRSGESEGAMFLSGILYARHKSVCIVTLPSGESKVFEVGESLDGKRRVTAIKSDAITIRASIDREYKVGQEINVK
jgi:hypothetical protein